MRNIFSLLLFSIFISGLCAQGLPQANQDSLFKYINFLGSDKLEGRGTGSKGLKKAEQFIVNNLEKWQLQYAGDNNTFSQNIPLHSSHPLAHSTLQLSFHDKTIHLLLNEQFLLIKTGVQTYIPVPKPVVFAGYGINAPEYDYNDYLELDVAGKIVVLLDGEPFSENDSDYFSGSKKTLYSFPESKIRTAFARGAIGTIIIPSIRSDSSSTWMRKQMEYSFEDVSLPQRSSSHLGVFLNKESAELLFSTSVIKYNQILEHEGKNSLNQFELNLNIAFNGYFKSHDFKSSNIIARITGSDENLKDEYIIIGAHYDHLGIGKPVKNDSIYNGVLDNAVGGSVVLELARMFSTTYLKPRRSILFIFFTGEEKGLLGSEYYTQHPYTRLSQTKAMINIDGLAALGNFKSLIGIGASYSTLGTILIETAAEHGYSIEKIKDDNIDHLYTRSDQLSFARSGVPSIMIIEGYNYEDINRDNVYDKAKKWYNEVYHTPFDDLSQPINYNAIKNYTDFIFAYSNRLINTSQKIEWKKGVPYKSIRLQSKAAKEN